MPRKPILRPNWQRSVRFAARCVAVVVVLLVTAMMVQETLLSERELPSVGLRALESLRFVDNPQSAIGAVGARDPDARLRKLVRSTVEPAHGSSLEVTVVDEEGQPMAAVPVALHRAQEGTDVSRASTDSLGVATLPSIQVHSWVVANCGEDRIVGHASETRILLEQPSNRVVRIVLRTATSRLQVQVVDDLGVPLRGVAVRLEGEGTQRSDGLGLVTWSALVAGRHRVVVRRGDSDSASELASELTLERGRQLSHVIVVTRPGAIRVVLELEPTIPGAAKFEVPPWSRGVHVSLTSRDGSQPQVVLQGFPGDTVELASMEPGRYLVSVDADHELHWLPTNVPQTVLVTAGGVAELRIEPAPSAGPIRGVVTDIFGRGIASAPVRMVSVDRNAVGVVVRTEEEGRFEFFRTPMGELRLDVYVPRIADREREFSWLGDGSSSGIAVNAGALDTRLVLHRGWTVECRLMGGADLTQDVHVWIDRARMNHAMQSSETRLVDDFSVHEFHNLRAGTYRVWLERRGKRESYQTVVLPATDSSFRRVIEWDLGRS